MQSLLAVIRFILLAATGLFFSGLAIVLVLNLHPEYPAASWLAAAVCAPLGINALYCLYSGKQAWVTRIGPLP